MATRVELRFLLLVILGVFGHCAALTLSAPMKATTDGNMATKAPRVFVSVLSKRSHHGRRAAFRKRWEIAALGNKFKMKFSICLNNDTVIPKLNNESATHKDLLFLQCREGAEWGRLAKKALAGMKVYNGFFSKKYELLMQVEDDTFVAWHRLQRFLREQIQIWPQKHPGLTIASSYMGVPTPERRLVDRNPNSLTYQPEDVFPAETYPIYMQRLGYILGKDVVHAIIENGVTEARMMANSDQAIGVWIDMVKRRKVPVKFVKLPGRLMEEPLLDSGKIPCGSAWKDYPWILHHGLQDQDHTCLSNVDKDNHEDGHIGHCFYHCQKSA